MPLFISGCVINERMKIVSNERMKIVSNWRITDNEIQIKRLLFEVMFDGHFLKGKHYLTFHIVTVKLHYPDTYIVYNLIVNVSSLLFFVWCCVI